MGITMEGYNSPHATLGEEFGEVFSKLCHDQCMALGFTLTEPIPTEYKAAIAWANRNQKKTAPQNGWRLTVSPPDSSTFMVSVRLDKGSASCTFFFFERVYEGGLFYVSYNLQPGMFAERPEALAVMLRFLTLVTEYQPAQVPAV